MSNIRVRLKQAPGWPVGIFAGILALLAVAGAAVVPLLVGSEEGHAQLAGSLPVRVVYAEKAGPHRYQLFVIDQPGSAPRPVGTAEAFGVVRISPDGRTIAALAPAPGPGKAAVLLVIGASTHRVELPGQSLASAIAWAPTGDYVAVVGATTYLVDTRGTVLDSYAIASTSPDGRVHTVVSGGYEWAPDGDAFVAIVNGELLIMRPGAQAKATSLDEILPGAARVFVEGWLPGVGPVLADGESRVAVAIAGPDLAPEPLGGRTVLAPAGLRGLSAEVRLRAESAVAQGTLLWMRPSADGQGALAEVRDKDGNGAIVTFAFAGNAAEARVTGFDLETTHGGGLVDAALLQ
jgi:dipeptidyl aminopeptidase/acylaminoacyl peptidase